MQADVVPRRYNKGVTLLIGTNILLRPVRAVDLDLLYDAHVDLVNRGRYFPRGFLSETSFRKSFNETGMWQREEGMLLIIGDRDEIIGHIEFYIPISYWDAFELSYLLYKQESAGHGYVTEAVQLLVDYLFAVRKQHRIQLVIVPDNAPSRRIAEKCGFALEGTARGAFFNDGRSQDVLLYSLLRTDPRPWLPPAD